MTMHLSTDDLASAVDGTLGAAASTHLETCASCRQVVAELSAVVAAMKAESVPEPSPLFWDLFSARVRMATEPESTPDQRPWWTSRPVLALGGLAVAVLLLVWSFPSSDRSATIPAPATATSGATPTDPDVEWRAMSDMAASMTADDVRTATAPAPDRTSMLSELSDDERAAFVALLKMEMGDVQ
jgi:hypothetical protein